MVLERMGRKGAKNAYRKEKKSADRDAEKSECFHWYTSYFDSNDISKSSFS